MPVIEKISILENWPALADADCTAAKPASAAPAFAKSSRLQRAHVTDEGKTRRRGYGIGHPSAAPSALSPAPLPLSTPNLCASWKPRVLSHRFPSFGFEMRTESRAARPSEAPPCARPGARRRPERQQARKRRQHQQRWSAWRRRYVEREGLHNLRCEIAAVLARRTWINWPGRLSPRAVKNELSLPAVPGYLSLSW